jgi:hypothetical protein
MTYTYRAALSILPAKLPIKSRGKQKKPFSYLSNHRLFRVQGSRLRFLVIVCTPFSRAKSLSRCTQWFYILRIRAQRASRRLDKWVLDNATVAKKETPPGSMMLAVIRPTGNSMAAINVERSPSVTVHEQRPRHAPAQHSSSIVIMVT